MENRATKKQSSNTWGDSATDMPKSKKCHPPEENKDHSLRQEQQPSASVDEKLPSDEANGRLGKRQLLDENNAKHKDAKVTAGPKSGKENEAFATYAQAEQTVPKKEIDENVRSPNELKKIAKSEKQKDDEEQKQNKESETVPEAMKDGNNKKQLCAKQDDLNAKLPKVTEPESSVASPPVSALGTADLPEGLSGDVSETHQVCTMNKPQSKAPPVEVSLKPSVDLPTNIHWDLESALHHVVNSWSSSGNNNNSTNGSSAIGREEREYLWRSSKDKREIDNETTSSGETTNRRKISPWVTFRMGHAGDVSELAQLYRESQDTVPSSKSSSGQQRQQQQQSDETTSFEVRLAEGLGDEDHPPVVFCLLAFVHYEDADNDKALDNNDDNKIGVDTKPSEESDWSVAKDLSHMAAAVLLAEQTVLTTSTNQSERMIRIEWMYISDDDKIGSPEMAQNIQSRLWLRLSAIALLLMCPIHIVGGSDNRTRAAGAVAGRGSSC